MIFRRTRQAGFRARWLLLVALVSGLAGADEEANRAWAEVPAILARIVPPVFPQRDFDITAYGAVAGGTEKCTAAFASAILACSEAGGGRVVVPKGKFLTGSIHLRSQVELHLADGAVVVFSDRFEDYLPVVPVRVGGIDILNYSPLIYARNCTNIAVTGNGKLNGNAARWWQWKGRETGEHFRMGSLGVAVEKRVFGTPEAAIRPNFLCLYQCRNILLEGFTIGSGPNWTIHPVYSENITIRGVTVDTDGPNNDGVDPDSCRDVLIEDCTFSTGDDCVVLKSGYNEDGWRVGRPTENVIMRNCTSKRGHGGLVIGSEMSGGVRKVFMQDCAFEGTDRAIRIKSKRGRGGVVEKIYARDIQVRDMIHEAVILNMDYSADKNQPGNTRAPVFRDMCFERIVGKGAPVGIRIIGEKDSPITDIRFSEIDLTAGRGVVAEWVNDLRFGKVRLMTREGAVFDLSDATGVEISAAEVSPHREVFLHLNGASSGGIRIATSPAAQGRIRTGEGVAEGAVGVE